MVDHGGEGPARRTPARAVDTRARKYGGGVGTLPLYGRLAVTFPVLVLGALLGVSLFLRAERRDPRSAAMDVLGLAIWLVVVLVLLPSVWRPSAEWRRRRYESRLLEARLRSSLERAHRVDPWVRPMQTGCPVCGQDSTHPVAPARVRCTTCHRPWTARAA